MSILEFIIANSAKHDVINKTLSKDLLQMGVELEHSDIIVQQYMEN